MPLENPYRATSALSQSASSRREFIRASSILGGVAAFAGLATSGDRLATGNVQADRIAKQNHQGKRNCPAEVLAALSGPWPSISTPFTRQGEIDFASLYVSLDHLIEEAKAKAVVLTWGDSLYSLLTDEEIAELTKAVCRHVKKRAFVVAADNRWWTGKEVQFANYCIEVGADMLMVLPPDWAQSTTIDTLVAHYQAVSKSIPVMIVTNFLISRGADFGLELISRLCREVPGVMALKDDMCGSFIRKTCLQAHEYWALSAGGSKENHMNMYPYGADGYLSTFMHFKPEIAWRYWNAIDSGNLQDAVAVIRDYDNPLFKHLLATSGSFDAGIHGILELYGLGTRYRRAPYHSLTDQQMEILADFLKQKQLL